MADLVTEKNYIASKGAVSIHLGTAYDNNGKLVECEYELCVDGDYFKLDAQQFVALAECMNDLMVTVNTSGLADDMRMQK